MNKADSTPQHLPLWLNTNHLELAKLNAENALSHALLLIGKDGGGQHLLAKTLAQDILCENRQQEKACGTCHSCQLNLAGTHPDYHYLDGLDGVIKVDQIRHVITKVATSAQVSHAKVVVLAQAGSMNINASNALLKALEEPPEGTFFLLTSDASSQIMATVRSRCMLINLPEPTQSEMLEWFENAELEGDHKGIFWVTQQPFKLYQLVSSGRSLLYQDIPNNLYQYLKGDMAADTVLSKLDNKNADDYLFALTAFMHHSICYSTGEKVPNQEILQPCLELLVNRLGVHKIMDCFTRLQAMKDKMQKTNLNPQIQIKSELIYWLS